MNKYNVNNYSIETILNWVNSNEIAIPEIQRPFVWSSTQVRDLIDSLYKGFPVGYIITWQNSDVKLKDGSKSRGKKILIDGQQRVTALTASILGNKVVDSDYKKKKIKISYNLLEEKFEVANSIIEKNSNIWIQDISEVFQNTFDSFSFVNDFYSNMNKEDYPDITPSEINNRVNKLLGIKRGQIGIIELEENLSLETVTEIFIRINSKGVVLSSADFVMSKIAVDEENNGNKIRKTIDYFCHIQKNPADLSIILENDTEFKDSKFMKNIEWIGNLSDDIYTPTYEDILKVIFIYKFKRSNLSDFVSLLSGRNFETRSYENEIIVDTFKNLEDGIFEYINQSNFENYLMILKSIGITSKISAPNQSILNFSYGMYLLLKSKKLDSNTIEKLISRWTIFAMITSRYTNSSDSKYEMDIKKIENNPQEYLNDEISLQITSEFWEYFLLSRLEGNTQNNSYFKLFKIAQVKLGYRCFLSSSHTVKTLLENRGDVHHVFPIRYLQKNGKSKKEEYNQIANYVLMQRENNIKIADKNPKEYFNNILEDIKNKGSSLTSITSEEELLENFKENAIPKEIFNMDAENYDEYLKLRRKLMRDIIKEFFYKI